MPQLRLALAQVDATVGDLGGNAATVLIRAGEAAAAGAHLVAFPEMVLTGYPVEDLALRSSFVDASRAALDRLARDLADAGLADLVAVVGYLDRAAAADGTRVPGVPQTQPHGSPQNSVAVVHRGRVAARHAKHHLPNYGVFDEYRYFVPGDTVPVVRVHGVDVAVCICEDLWRAGPADVAREAGAGLLVVVNGSPYERDKDDTRLELCTRRAREGGCALAYVNLVGGQDELVFDGDSLVVDHAGELVARAGRFVAELLVVDLDLAAAEGDPTPGVTSSPATGLRVSRTVLSADPLPAYEPAAARCREPLDPHAEVHAALVSGLAGYVRKNGFASVVLGLSGGIDSALVASVACDALGPERVHCVSLPSDYSSPHSRADAAELAARTGCHFTVQPIAPMVRAYLDRVKLTGLAEENLQARVRGALLMGLSNQHGHLVLATGNKSELAVGYSTLYGDSVGGFAPIKDVPKTLVWELARWRNAEAIRRGETPPIPEAVIEKPPSAELRPGQLDSDSLPDYPLLDDILDAYVERDASSAELVDQGFDEKVVADVLRLVDGAEFKRRQYPPGPKISVRNFGRDRRLPITNAWREHLP